MPLVVLNTVGLTGRLLPLAPRLHQLAEVGWQRPLREVLPAVTCTAQATMFTGRDAAGHGIVGNGWLFRDTGEVRFWQQSNRLLQAEPFYETARRRAAARGRPFRCAKLFWWFNQGAAVDLSVTPKPHYGADGNKVFDILTTPPALAEKLKGALGAFPFPSFWGPTAGLPATEWIAHCAATVLREQRPDLTLVYLPHLDYDPQRHGPQGCDLPRLVRQLDDACAPVLDEAGSAGAPVWVVNEYTHVPVSRVVTPNRALRQAGLLSVRGGPFGEQLDTFASRVFAVCDHQLAHVYVREPRDLEPARALLGGVPGIARILAGDERAELGLDHPRAGELVVLAEPDAWLAYPFWLDDRQAPDYARTVNIHAKPGYDPCELFFDPQRWWPAGRVLWRLLQKKLGFRVLFDVVPLDPSLVKGSHGLAVTEAGERPVLVGNGPAPSTREVPMTAVRDLILDRLELNADG
jgi:predicted AlkP superfamily pyrophosphatase or phosphodiesterase